MAESKEDPGKPDETVPGGAYIRGGKPRKDGKHYGGHVVDAEGEVLAEFDDDEVNPGKDWKPKSRAEPKADPKPPAK